MYFYGVHFYRPDAQFAFDALRFLAEPDAYRKAHITVRGPYQRHIDIERFPDVKLGSMQVFSAGSFFGPRQNTVFLYCSIPGYVDLVKKNDFGSSPPHLTIYDGRSREEAMAIQSALRSFPWMLWFEPTDIGLLERKTVNNEMIDILEYEFASRFRRAFRTGLNMKDVPKLRFSQRLDMMRGLMKSVHDRSAYEDFRAGRRVG